MYARTKNVQARYTKMFNTPLAEKALRTTKCQNKSRQGLKPCT